MFYNESVYSRKFKYFFFSIPFARALNPYIINVGGHPI